MNRLTVGVYRRATDGPVFIGNIVRFLCRLRAARHRFGKRFIRVRNFQRNIVHPVAVLTNVFCRCIVGDQRCGENEICLAFAYGVGRSLPLPSFKATVCYLREPESHAIEVGCLPCIANPEFNMVNTFQLEWILHVALHSCILSPRVTRGRNPRLPELRPRHPVQPVTLASPAKRRFWRDQMRRQSVR